jgi:hypothetical protein
MADCAAAINLLDEVEWFSLFSGKALACASTCSTKWYGATLKDMWSWMSAKVRAPIASEELCIRFCESFSAFKQIFIDMCFSRQVETFLRDNDIQERQVQQRSRE